MALSGKGFFTWKLQNVEGGNPGAIVTLARLANLSHVLVKIADGTFPYNIDLSTGLDRALQVTLALRANGIQVWGWHYVYGDEPIAEASRAIQRIQALNVDGYVINAEAEYKSPAKREAARQFMNQLRSVLPKLPVALSSYRFPSIHPDLPWREFLERCDYNMPQVYWIRAHNPGAQLVRTLREFQSVTPYRPIVATGAAFYEAGWQPTVAEVMEFMQTARSLNIPAVNFWEWANTRSGRLPEVWESIRDFPWGPVTPIPADISQRFIAALNTRDPAQVASLYTPSAIHINSVRTVQGHEAITTWYQALFSQILPEATFTLTGFSGTGSTRHLTWTAVSSQGRVQNGSDTLGLTGEQILYHYTFFSVIP
jgi:hypothetical protein